MHKHSSASLEYIFLIFQELILNLDFNINVWESSQSFLKWESTSGTSNNHEMN